MDLYKYAYNGKYKDIIQCWGDLEDCEEYEKSIDSWLNQFNNNDKNLALTLLTNFQMYRRRYLSEKIKKIYSELLNTYSWAKDIKTFFMLLNLKQRVSNSLQFACEFRKVVSININQEVQKLNNDEINLLNNKLVFIDDFSGTGSTFIETIDILIHKNKKYKDFVFIFLIINISETAKKNIIYYAELNKLNINIITTYTSEKAFKEGNIFNEFECKESKNRYYNIIQQFDIKSNAFGFMQSESLIAFDKCVPNNNLSLFRENSSKYKALIYRERPLEDDLLLYKKNKVNLYIIKNKFKSTKNIFNIDLLYFILYCTMYGQRLNVSNCCKVFGMTATQYSNRLDLCENNDLIKKDDEKYVLGRNFDNIFKFNNSNKRIIKVIKNMIKNKFIIEEKSFCDIIRYTPLDFERRFASYKKED